MSNRLLFGAIDGWDYDLAEYYSHPFWESIRDDALILEIPKPGGIESGDVATASSPRLWGRIYSGCEPERNGLLGFWEKKLEDGTTRRAKVGTDWIQETRCEKLVFSTDFLVPPLWNVAADESRSIGSTATWFTYPITDTLREAIDGYGGWCLTDAPFPFDSDRMEMAKLVHPRDAYPNWDEDYLEEVGAGMMTPVMAKEDPEGFHDDLVTADEQRYRHVAEQVAERGVPDLTMTMTRGVDAFAHKFRKEEDFMPHYPGWLQDGEANMKRIMDANFDGLQRLWDEYDFDHLVFGGDHGCGKRITDGEVEFVGDDHAWPARFVIFSDDVTGGQTVQARYEDIAPTVLDLLEIDQPEHMQGATVLDQAKIESRLRALGYDVE